MIICRSVRNFSQVPADAQQIKATRHPQIPTTACANTSPSRNGTLKPDLTFSVPDTIGAHKVDLLALIPLTQISNGSNRLIRKLRKDDFVLTFKNRIAGMGTRML